MAPLGPTTFQDGIEESESPNQATGKEKTSPQEEIGQERKSPQEVTGQEQKSPLNVQEERSPVEIDQKSPIMNEEPTQAIDDQDQSLRMRLKEHALSDQIDVEVGGGFTGLSDIQPDFNNLSNGNQTLAEIFDQLEKMTGLTCEEITYGIAGGVATLIGLYLIFGAGAKLVCNVLIGTTYPAITSFRALHTKDESQSDHFMVYWLVFGGFILADSLLFRVPAYFLIKAIILIAIMLWQSPTKLQCRVDCWTLPGTSGSLEQITIDKIYVNSPASFSD